MSGQRCVGCEALVIDRDKARAEVARLREALREIKHELGVPDDNYPAPVANAVEIANRALGDTPNE
jgi:acyl-CoA reductase-like NAD-dependent aldehyde dehydrogenase